MCIRDSISNDLPQAPINVVREHPRNKNVLFVGHEQGLCVSIDRGASWQKLAGGMPSVAVHDVVVHPREMDLVVGTHGRGLWIFDIAALEEIDGGVTGRPISLVPPRDGWLLRGGFSRGFRGSRNWVARNPELNPTFRYVLGAEASSPAKVEVLDAAEKVLFTATGSAKAGLHEVVWSQQGRGQGPGRGQGQGGRQGGAPGGGQGGPASQGSQPAPQEAFRMTPGQYRLRITLGTTKLERTFVVTAAADYAPAFGFGFGTDEDAEDDESEEEEGEAPSREGEPRVRDR